MEVYKFYEIQKHMTLTRHVYSSHIDVASLAWWNGLSPGTRELVQTAMKDAARYQRSANRVRNDARLKLLIRKGMIVESQPDITAFRKKVEGLKGMHLYKEPRVRNLLTKILKATQ